MANPRSNAFESLSGAARLGAALVTLVACSPCSYLDMMNRRAQRQSQFDRNPTQKLALRLAPEGVFAVEGTLPRSDLPLLITAIVRGTNEPVGAHVVVPTLGSACAANSTRACSPKRFAYTASPNRTSASFTTRPCASQFVEILDSIAAH